MGVAPAPHRDARRNRVLPASQAVAPTRPDSSAPIGNKLNLPWTRLHGSGLAIRPVHEDTPPELAAGVRPRTGFHRVAV